MDIVKRLRQGRTDLHREAADEIERLRAVKTPASASLLNLTKAMLDSAEAECKQLRAALERYLHENS